MKDISISETIITSDMTSAEMVSYLYGLAEAHMDADEVINEILSGIGSRFDLDCIVIKELVEQMQAVRCTYEWTSNGEKYLLNTERRFFLVDFDTWEDRFGEKARGYFIYNKEEGTPVPFHLVRTDKVVTLLDMPIYKGDTYIGCVNFTDYKPGRVWTEAEIKLLQQVCRLLSSYLFGMRVKKVDKDEVRNLVFSDSLTGLPNYDIFCGRVMKALSIKDGMSIAIISSDLVNFKYINERFGYEKGNRILQIFTQELYRFFDRIVSCCREYSDNFIYAIKFQDDIDAEAVRFKIDRFVHEVYSKVEDYDNGWKLCINSGIYLMHEGEIALDDAITKANSARKEAKKQIGIEVSRSVVYADELIEVQKRELDLVLAVDGAIANEEFKVYYQPKYNCTGSRILGAEALIRWQKPDGSFIYPDKFIPALENNGSIIKTDYFVYNHVFSYLRDRLDAGLECVPISMNVSRYHLFSEAFINYIVELQELYKLPPELIEFEITENMYMGDFPLATFTMERLKSMNMSISMDDFGSQFSSIEILTKYPIDTIKLDKVFMKDQLEGIDKILISSIIDMAKKLKMKVLCEGVENEAQRAFLEDSCCDLIQGYIFSRPIPEAAFDELLEVQAQMTV